MGGWRERQAVGTALRGCCVELEAGKQLSLKHRWCPALRFVWVVGFMFRINSLRTGF